MARFDVYVWEDAYAVDCQANLLAALSTRFIVPLLGVQPEQTIARLNPVLPFQGQSLILMPQLATTVMRHELSQWCGSVADHDYVISAALDVLTSGF